MNIVLVLALGMIIFFAFVLKGMTGFGPAIVSITFGSLFLHPHDLIPLSSMLDFVAGILLFVHQFRKGGWRYWLPMMVSIMAGAVLGGLLLKQVDVEVMKLILSVCILILGFWFAFVDPNRHAGRLAATLPEKSRFSDLAVSLFSGWLGGFISISGPPLVWHVGRQFQKVAFRQILIPVFLGAACMRVVTYASIGLINETNLIYAALTLPFLLMGLYVGNHIFYKISESVFKRIVGYVLIVMAVRMLVVYFV